MATSSAAASSTTSSSSSSSSSLITSLLETVGIEIFICYLHPSNLISLSHLPSTTRHHPPTKYSHSNMQSTLPTYSIGRQHKLSCRTYTTG
mmetsp:Transcript_31864/g.53923  ORF Transcript_31864/g.53923 Transcript_31864/m.53923 type:complete len:91 (-) Transcript_31864:590-862(-)